MEEREIGFNKGSEKQRILSTSMFLLRMKLWEFNWVLKHNWVCSI